MRNRDDFGRLAGEYRVTQKPPSNESNGTARLSGNGPLLDLVWTFEDGSKAKGTLSMNEQSRVTGAGSYEHFRGAGGWGDFSVQVATRERDAVRLLVDGQYTDQANRKLVATAWVWQKLPNRELGD